MVGLGGLEEASIPMRRGWGGGSREVSGSGPMSHE